MDVLGNVCKVRQLIIEIDQVVDGLVVVHHGDIGFVVISHAVGTDQVVDGLVAVHHGDIGFVVISHDGG